MAFDSWLLESSPCLHWGWAPAFFVFVTNSGNVAVLATLVAAGWIGCALTGRRRAGQALLLAGLGSLLIDCSIKFLVGRVRPDVAWRLIEVPQYPSFPSGHALGGLAVYATLGWVLRGRVGLALGAAWGVMIGLSRVLVGVHYPTDVLAGMAIGAGITAAAVHVAGEKAGQGRRSPEGEPAREGT